MNASPYFRYYAAFVLIMLLVLLLRVQARPDSAGQPAPADAIEVGAVATHYR